MKSRWRVAGAIAAFLVVFSAVWLWASAKYPAIFVEHGPMENFQTVCLIGGMIAFLCQYLGPTPPGVARVALVGRQQRVSGRQRRGDPTVRAFFAGLALFYATFVLLEFDTRELNWRWADNILNGPVRNAWLGAIWAGAFVWFFRQRRALIAFARTWLFTAAGVLLCAAGMFWVAGGVVDKLHLLGSESRNMLGEELLENNAALLMLLSALASLRNRNSVSDADENAVTNK